MPQINFLTARLSKWAFHFFPFILPPTCPVEAKGLPMSWMLILVAGILKIILAYVFCMFLWPGEHFKDYKEDASIWWPWPDVHDISRLGNAILRNYKPLNEEASCGKHLQEVLVRWGCLEHCCLFCLKSFAWRTSKVNKSAPAVAGRVLLWVCLLQSYALGIKASTCKLVCEFASVTLIHFHYFSVDKSTILYFDLFPPLLCLLYGSRLW